MKYKDSCKLWNAAFQAVQGCPSPWPLVWDGYRLIMTSLSDSNWLRSVPTSEFKVT